MHMPHMAHRTGTERAFCCSQLLVPLLVLAWVILLVIPLVMLLGMLFVNSLGMELVILMRMELVNPLVMELVIPFVIRVPALAQVLVQRCNEYTMNSQHHNCLAVTNKNRDFYSYR